MLPVIRAARVVIGWAFELIFVAYAFPVAILAVGTPLVLVVGGLVWVGGTICQWVRSL